MAAGKRKLKQALRRGSVRGDYAQVDTAENGVGAVQMTEMEGVAAASGAPEDSSAQHWDEEAQALMPSVGPAQVPTSRHPLSVRLAVLFSIYHILSEEHPSGTLYC